MAQSNCAQQQQQQQQWSHVECLLSCFGTISSLGRNRNIITLPLFFPLLAQEVHSWVTAYEWFIKVGEKKSISHHWPSCQTLPIAIGVTVTSCLMARKHLQIHKSLLSPPVYGWRLFTQSTRNFVVFFVSLVSRLYSSMFVYSTPERGNADKQKRHCLSWLYRRFCRR